MNKTSVKLAKPRNDWTSLTFLGSGQSWMTWTLAEYMRRLPEPIMYPRNSTESEWKQHLSPFTKRLLRHSFYFYFYFEHLNFTWSYLIDTKISWSLDHISWSYLLILSWQSYLLIHDLISWSTILSWSLDLIIWWWSKIRFFYFITYMHSTCLWLMSFIDDRHAFYTCCCATCFYLTFDTLWTHILHVFTLRTTHGHLYITVAK